LHQTFSESRLIVREEIPARADEITRRFRRCSATGENVRCHLWGKSGYSGAFDAFERSSSK